MEGPKYSLDQASPLEDSGSGHKVPTPAERPPSAKAREVYGLGSGAIPDLYAFLDERTCLFIGLSWAPSVDREVASLGAFYNHPELGYCLLVNSDTTLGRQAFTLAHEFAHALFHYPSRGLISWKGERDPREKFADVFAAHFLVPTKQLKDLVEDDRQSGWPDPYEALQLASYFRVSYATLLYRLFEEKIIEGDTYRVAEGIQPEPDGLLPRHGSRRVQHPRA